MGDTYGLMRVARPFVPVVLAIQGGRPTQAKPASTPTSAKAALVGDPGLSGAPFKMAGWAIRPPAKWSLLLVAKRVALFRVLHFLGRRVDLGHLGRGRVPATMFSEVEVRHHTVHRATGNGAGVHGAGGRLIHKLNVTGN